MEAAARHRSRPAAARGRPALVDRHRRSGRAPACTDRRRQETPSATLSTGHTLALVDIAIPVFDQITALDAIGPYEVLQRLPEATIHFVGYEAGPVRTDNGMLGLIADRTFEEVQHPDVIVFP